MQLSTNTIARILGEHFDWEYCGEYGEPGYGGYGAPTLFVVLGDYWLSDTGYGVNKDTHPERGRAPRSYGTNTSTLRSMEDRWPHLWAQMESQGVAFEWYDEWTVDYESDKAYRTSPDSYSWESSIAYMESGDLLTPDSDISDWLEYAVNEPTVALTDAMVGGDVGAVLEREGFTRYDLSNGVDHRYQNGWHPGQTDTPKAVTDVIRSRMGPDVEIVFAIDGVGQFDIAFGAYTRMPEQDEDD